MQNKAINQKIVAIGDLHGHFYELKHLMERVLKECPPDEYTYVFLGDYVDGGPQTKDVIDYLMGMQKKYPHWVFLYGNHEDLMLDALKYNQRKYKSWDLWWGQGGRQTAYSYYPSELTRYERAISQPKDHIDKSHTDWLDDLPLCYESEKYFFVHAGVMPNLSLDEHKRIVKNPKSVGEAYVRENMLWIREGFLESEYDWGKKIIFGHTVFPCNVGVGVKVGKTGEPLFMKNKIGIDCMRHNFGKLVALKLPEEEIYEQRSIDR